MNKLNKIFLSIAIVIGIYALVGFKLVPIIAKSQIVKISDEKLTQKTSIEKIEFNPFTLKTDIYNYKLGINQTKPTASLEHLQLDIGVWKSISKLHLNIENALIKNLYLNAKEYKDGTFSFEKLVKPSKEKEIPKEKEEDSTGIKFLVSKLFLENAKLDFEKQSDKKTYKISIHDLNYKIRNLGTYKNALASNDLKLQINNSTKLSIDGAFRLSPFKFYGKTKLNNLKIKEILDYDTDILNFEVGKKANLNLDVNFDIDMSESNEVKLNSSNINISNFLLKQNNQKIISLKEFKVNKFDFDLDKQKININTPNINTLFVNIIQDKNGLNMSNLTKPSKQKEETKDSKPWDINITDTKLANSSVFYEDKINTSKISNKKINTSIKKISTNGTDVDVKDFLLKVANIDFKDDKNKINVSINNTDTKFNTLEIKDKTKLSNFKINTSNINFADNKNILKLKTNSIKAKLDKLEMKDTTSLDNFTLDTSNINFEDGKNIILANVKKLELKANKVNQKNSDTNINNISLNTKEINFKNKDEIIASLENHTLKLTKTNINKDKININTINSKLSDINFNQIKSQLKLTTKEINLNTNNLLVNGSKVDIKKINLNSPAVNFKDDKNKLLVNTNMTNISLNSFGLNNSNIAIAKVKLLQKGINFQDVKNSLSLKTDDLSINVNKLSSKKNNININLLQIKEPKIHFSNTKEKTNFLAKNIDLDVYNIHSSDDLFSIKKTILKQPQLTVSLGKVQKKAKKKTTKKIVKKAKKTQTPSKKIKIGPLDIKNAKFNFEDKNLQIPFKTTISSLNGRISKYINNDKNTSRLKVNGNVDKYGTAKITGIVDPNDIKVLTDIKMHFDNIAMKNLSPYSGKFIGRKIDEGKISLDLKYNIKKSNLKAKNEIIIKQLKLGENVKSKDAVFLPLDLAISLLKNNDGVIDINLPVSGNLDNPEFSVAPIVWKAFINLITKAISAPFSLLGAVFGFDENEIKNVKFDYGHSYISVVQKETLDKVAKILLSKKDFGIILIPSYDKNKDAFALKKVKFNKIKKDKIQSYKTKNYEEFYIAFLERLYKSLGGNRMDLRMQYINDNTAYIENLEKDIIRKQKISVKDLEDLAFQRVKAIQKYLLEVKKIPAKQVTTNPKIKVQKSLGKTLNIDLDVKKL